MAARNGFLTRYAKRTHWGTRSYKARSVLLPLAMYVSIQVMNRYFKMNYYYSEIFLIKRKAQPEFKSASGILRFTVGQEGFIEACVIEPVFWLMRFGCIKHNAKKLAYAS